MQVRSGALPVVLVSPWEPGATRVPEAVEVLGQPWRAVPEPWYTGSSW